MTDWRAPQRANYQQYRGMDGIYRPKQQMQSTHTQQARVQPEATQAVTPVPQQPVQAPLQHQPAQRIAQEASWDAFMRQGAHDSFKKSERKSLFKRGKARKSRPALKISMPKLQGVSILHFKTWHEFRIFAAGAALSMSLIGFGFYLGITKPTLGYEGVKGDVEAYDERMTVYGPPVDIGVNPDQVDKNEGSYTILPEMPAKLTIDSIGVETDIIPLGLSRNGALAVPSKLSQVGWYKPSAKPGTKGTIVLDGHFGSSDEAVFKNLHKVMEGDTIALRNGAGENFVYQVEKHEYYHKSETPMANVVATDGTERLNIISCFGPWLEQEKTYEKRQVIYAKRIN